jgi:O-antigen biosynthesis protein
VRRPSAVSPRVTVFTATYRPTLLDECLQTLLRQGNGDWEWVIVLNQGARWRPAPEDPRIRIVIDDALGGAGATKRLACSVALGEILVGLDDHDLLSSDALETVVGVFDAHPGIGFVYSDTGRIREDGTSDRQHLALSEGWSCRDVNVDGRSLSVPDSMEPYPHNVSHPRYAPGHVRAFRRSVYEQAGGYDASLDVLVDEDLTCRIYQHTDFHHIPRCLYLQRLSGALTHADREPDAVGQDQAFGVYERYVQPNALAWARRRGLLALDLGAAHNKPAGYLGVDQYEGEGVDIVADVSKGIDLPDSSVGVIRAVDFLEHVSDKIAMFNELYRLLAHGGMLLSLTPSTDGRGAFQDPTHVSPYNENSFWYFTDREMSSRVPAIKSRFQVSTLFTLFLSEWHEQNMVPYVCANLVAVKDGPRQGGFLNV